MTNRREVKIERSGTEGPISEKTKIPEKEKRKHYLGTLSTKIIMCGGEENLCLFYAFGTNTSL